jgi:hypothetical protein
MESLRQEIRAMMRQLAIAPPTAGSAEEMTLNRLQTLCKAAERAQHPRELTPLLMELRQFWLHSIDWCSQLSKDIERLIILYDELSSDV